MTPERATTDSLWFQHTVAIIWDFDKTLIPGYMQAPLLRHFGVDEVEFWREVNALPDWYRRHGSQRVSTDVVYLHHLLEYVRAGAMAGLSNELLRRLGSQLTFYPGLPDFFERLRRRVADDPRYRQHDIRLEHYVISNGLRQMILGSAIAPYVDDVWACEFVDAPHPPGYLRGEQQALFPPEAGAPDPNERSHRAGEVTEVGYLIDNTSKTRAIFEINKGSNKYPREIDVNASIAPGDRRVPFERMIYVADGPSDIPAFSLVGGSGGATFGVYRRDSRGEFLQIKELARQGRIQAFGDADYSVGSHTALWLETEVERICDGIVQTQQRALVDRIGAPARHIADDRRPPAGDLDAPEQATEELAVAKSRPGRRAAARSSARSRRGAPAKAESNEKPDHDSRPPEVPLAERLTLVRGRSGAEADGADASQPSVDAPSEPGPAEPMPRSIRGV
ncbi:MAG: haloacid dehalogenase-like hydrolase [Chloroflexi bacterium]|nr:haloacid dehalogenase-like hydrolase [Chloroflexota bacterium]MDQ3406997.1 haloacid dehalogenase-like hydrolase [Chloroflexota bacterium]